ncbi:transcription termination factor Rho [Firmicutes bacterium AM41-11]|nr:transcription termination factor Rho [Firmicutes bacterium AM41-11]
MTQEQYEALSLKELKTIAKEKELKGVSALKKSDLIAALMRQQKEEARKEQENRVMDTDETAIGILEVLPDGFGFIRCENYLPGENDVYVSHSQIRRFHLKTGDLLIGKKRPQKTTERYSALVRINSINGIDPEIAKKRPNFENLTPIFPNERMHMEANNSISMRMLDLLAPVGKGARGMIVSPPKAGKTTLLKNIALSVQNNNPEMHLIILLIDERPEEVTDIKETVTQKNTEVIYSTFDETPEHHKRVSEMVIERAKRFVEHGQDVIILLDSITRLARAYNLTVAPSGRTLSGGLDPASLHMPKRFFGAARNMREGGSLTILATALVDTGSKMDDVVYEEFKGTGNMELILSRKMQEHRIFPAIDIAKSGTRREDLLLNPDELDAVRIIRHSLNSLRNEEATDTLISLFKRTKNNQELVNKILTKKAL